MPTAQPRQVAFSMDSVLRIYADFLAEGVDLELSLLWIRPRVVGSLMSQNFLFVAGLRSVETCLVQRPNNV